MALMVCSVNSRDCMLHKCEKCPGIIFLSKYIHDLLNSYGCEDEDEITYKLWVRTDRSELVSKTASISQYVEIICQKMDELITHHFIAKEQAKFLEKEKENIPIEVVIVHVDFSQNYSFIIQDAVQEFHWNNG